MLEQTLKSIVIERPDSNQYEQNLCLDKATAIPPVTRLQNKRATFLTFDRLARRNAIIRAGRSIPPDVG